MVGGGGPDAWPWPAAPGRSTTRRPGPPPVGPISPLQVGDLLSPEIFNKEGNLFATVEPERCAGVAREVDPPFIVDLPSGGT